MSIQLTEISKTYGAQKAVNAISFEANKGEIVGFLAEMEQENQLR